MPAARSHRPTVAIVRKVDRLVLALLPIGSMGNWVQDHLIGQKP
ncbi:MAG: hypothetical protein ACM3ZQ_04365 [Bacillota bacterium]